jgi:hypothetical protein
MKPKYEGRSPGRLWYMAQRTKALVSTFRNNSTKSDAKSLGKNSGLTTALLVGAKLAFGLTFFGIPSLLATVLAIGAVVPGFKAFKNFRTLKNSSPYLNYIRTQEDKWLAKQSGPKLGARIKSLFTKAGTAVGYALAAAGAALATTAGLQYAGVISAVALTTVLGTVATAVSLPVIIGVTAAAIPLGIIGALVCRKATRNLLGIKAPEKKTAAKTLTAQNDNKNSVNTQSVTNSFSQSATAKKSELNEQQLKNAEIRKKNRENNGPKF